jgi:hypothetical protein
MYRKVAEKSREKSDNAEKRVKNRAPIEHSHILAGFAGAFA